jgi:hypothetical protein
LAMRQAGRGERRCADAARAAVDSYRRRMREYAQMTALEVWYSHLSVDLFVQNAVTPEARKRWRKQEIAATLETPQREVPAIASVRSARPRIIDHPPLIYHPPEMRAIGNRVKQMLHRYRSTLPEERRIVLDRYELIDVARKVVGVGSVGTRCAVALLMAGPNDPLLLQFKEARRSVLEPYAGKSRYANQGQRVVTGQRMLQSASDVFLGWTGDDQGLHYYFRQLHDMRMKVNIDRMTKADWFEYVTLCGWVLARAHARTGDPARIAGYLGSGEAFDDAVVKFARAYADQTDRDYGLFMKAMRAGRVLARSPSHR